MNEEYLREQKLYDAIFDRIDKLTAKGVAIGTHWGRTKDGEEVLSPYDPRIDMLTLHAAATVASIDILQEVLGGIPPRLRGCKPHRATITSERFYLEKKEEQQ